MLFEQCVLSPKAANYDSMTNQKDFTDSPHCALITPENTLLIVKCINKFLWVHNDFWSVHITVLYIVSIAPELGSYDPIILD